MPPPLAFTHSYISELWPHDCEFMDIKLQGDQNHLSWCPHAALGMAPDSHGGPKHLRSGWDSGQKDGLILRFQI